jgi:heterodisulfide reductase subunit A
MRTDISVEKDRIEQLCKSLGGSNFGDVMVVGGGISGIQASLDLAFGGFKVYLVDKSPTIGGHMAQLDKTFPTNECST